MSLEESITSFCDSKLSGKVSAFVSNLLEENSKNDQSFQRSNWWRFHLLYIIVDDRNNFMKIEWTLSGMLSKGGSSTRKIVQRWDLEICFEKEIEAYTGLWKMKNESWINC